VPPDVQKSLFEIKLGVIVVAYNFVMEAETANAKMIEKIHSQCVNIQDRNSKSFNVVFFGHSNSGMQKNGNFCRILTFSPSIFTYIFFQIDIHIYTYLYIYTYALILLFSHSRTSFSLEKHILLLEGIISPLGKGHQ